MHVLWIIFGWPNGIVVGNLLASALIGVAAFMLGRKSIKQHVQKIHNMHELIEELYHHHIEKGIE